MTLLDRGGPPGFFNPQPTIVEPAEFTPFPSIPRLRRDMVVTEKLDGTNASIWISEDGAVMRCGSRNRWIVPFDDNYGFARWAHEHADELLTLGPGHHYGEWWGSGIQRGYGLTNGEKRFSLLNALRWSDELGKRPACCHVVPVLYRDVFCTEAVFDTSLKLSLYGSQAAPGFMNPEGIVVYHTASKQLYKYTLDGDGHKSAKAPKTRPAIATDVEVQA